MADTTTGTYGDQGGIGGTIGQIIDLVHGINGQPNNQANVIADAADPFRSQRPQYQGMLQNLLTNPNSFAMDPGTQFAMNQGTAAITRAANAQGVSRGGSVVNDIGQFVTGTAEQAYNQRIGQLETLSGATTGSPAAAGAAIAEGYKNQQGDLASGAGALNTLFNSLFGTSNTSGIMGMISHFLGTGGNGSDPTGGFINTPPGEMQEIPPPDQGPDMVSPPVDPGSIDPGEILNTLPDNNFDNIDWSSVFGP